MRMPEHVYGILFENFFLKLILKMNLLRNET